MTMLVSCSFLIKHALKHTMYVDILKAIIKHYTATSLIKIFKILKQCYLIPIITKIPFFSATVILQNNNKKKAKLLYLGCKPSLGFGIVNIPKD